MLTRQHRIWLLTGIATPVLGALLGSATEVFTYGYRLRVHPSELLTIVGLGTICWAISRAAAGLIISDPAPARPPPSMAEKYAVGIAVPLEVSGRALLEAELRKLGVPGATYPFCGAALAPLLDILTVRHADETVRKVEAVGEIERLAQLISDLHERRLPPLLFSFHGELVATMRRFDISAGPAS